MRRSAEALAAALASIDAAGLRRRRQTIEDWRSGARALVGGRELVSFCSNDYLGLARHPALAAAARAALDRYGTGSGAAHLVSGHTREHQALEEELAAFTGRERALLFSTGYMANLGIITALAGRGEVVLQDRLNHASLIDGARLAGAKLRRYAHADANDAATRLGDATVTLLATDGVFSMDGDVAPLAALARAARTAGAAATAGTAAAATAGSVGAWFLVDDAHGLGVIGATGRGSLEQAGLDSDAVPLLMGTLGKAFGCFGAFVAGEHDLIEYLMQRSRSYIYTTALPAALAAASRAALGIAASESWRRERLAALIARFRAGAAQLGLPLGASQTPIQPLIVGESATAIALSAQLAERGFQVGAIRPPTVPPGTARLRVTFSAEHSEADVDRLLQALDECGGAQ